MPGFLLDLDGTLYHGDRPIPYAAEFIEWLREKQYPFLFVTNNSSRTPGQVAAHLRRTGIRALPEEVLTSAQAACQYMKEQRCGQRVLCIGENGLHEALTDGGFQLASFSEPDGSHTSPIDVVVQGIDRSFDYTKLAAAVRAIRSGAPYILTNPDHLLPWNGELTPGAGSIAAAIERASECPPTVIGKPSPIIMRYAMERLQLSPAEVWAVGDNLRTDILGGIRAGTRTALVLTGLVKEADATARMAETGISPERVCRDLSELRTQIETTSPA